MDSLPNLISCWKNSNLPIKQCCGSENYYQHTRAHILRNTWKTLCIFIIHSVILAANLAALCKSYAHKSLSWCPHRNDRNMTDVNDHAIIDTTVPSCWLFIKIKIFFFFLTPQSGHRTVWKPKILNKQLFCGQECLVIEMRGGRQMGLCWQEDYRNSSNQSLQLR